ncbi:uncharacterized protein LOC113361495 [Papaver somniferum]|uniref:uncharacterized protein LOC113361495 n=1 Tax=Papaver somniferum TaxID=3469 RepID=UPI000E704F18|nr:uncharacterized protein LOC113361495 [Papaver somniferum]
MTPLTSASSSFSYSYGNFIGGLSLVGCMREGNGGAGGGGCGNSRFEVVVEEIGDGVLVEKVMEVLLAEGMVIFCRILCSAALRNIWGCFIFSLCGDWFTVWIANSLSLFL